MRIDALSPACQLLTPPRPMSTSELQSYIGVLMRWAISAVPGLVLTLILQASISWMSFGISEKKKSSGDIMGRTTSPCSEQLISQPAGPRGVFDIFSTHLVIDLSAGSAQHHS